LRRQRLEGTELLEAASARFARRFPERTLRGRWSESLPVLQADPSLLRRVLDNLLDNAAKFSDPGQPIELEAEAIAFPAAREIPGRGHRKGIAPAGHERVLEPIISPHRSRNRATGGVGLGLTVVRRFLVAHGGSVRVERDKRNGTCFHVTVPASGGDADVSESDSDGDTAGKIALEQA
jgi:K+-sensing histidine kinase KdpD